MTSPIPKLNMFMQGAALQNVGAVRTAMPQSATGGTTLSGNPFASMNSENTVGVNTNIGVGDVSYVSNQLGKSGTARTLAFA